jgi:hypothetical protein
LYLGDIDLSGFTGARLAEWDPDRQPIAGEKGSLNVRFSLTNDERNQLIIRHLDSVHAAANTFKVQPWIRDELMSAGYEALVLASTRFDPSSNATFTTFAYRCAPRTHQPTSAPTRRAFAYSCAVTSSLAIRRSIHPARSS